LVMLMLGNHLLVIFWELIQQHRRQYF
jgi:hypothetical protein